MTSSSEEGSREDLLAGALARAWNRIAELQARVEVAELATENGRIRIAELEAQVATAMQTADDAFRMKVAELDTATRSRIDAFVHADIGHMGREDLLELIRNMREALNLEEVK